MCLFCFKNNKTLRKRDRKKEYIYMYKEDSKTLDRLVSNEKKNI